MPTILIIGATSDIARASAMAFGLDGWQVRLAARNKERLEIIARDLSVRLNRPVPCYLFDALEPDSHRRLWDGLPEKPDAVLCAVGLLGDQDKARHDSALAAEIINSNFTGLLPLLSLAADEFEARKSGIIIGLSSVAGDRGRASNYVYGSAKAGLTAFLSGLRNRLAASGVRVITVKPGFVRTSMTEGMALSPLLTAEPSQVASDIIAAVKKGRDVIYSRWFWRYIMVIIKAIPEFMFKKSNL